MNEKIIPFPNRQIISNQTTGSREYTSTRAMSFKIRVLRDNFAQYVRTIKAYIAAKMPLRHIANAGDFLGDQVERKEVDAPLRNFEKGASGFDEQEKQVTAWQSRRKIIFSAPQMITQKPTSGQEVTISSQDLVVANEGQETILEVVEGIQVADAPSNIINFPTPNELPDPNKDNPYLKPEPLPKAA